MKTFFKTYSFALLFMLILGSCEKDNPKTASLSDVKLSVNFGAVLKSLKDIPLTLETPGQYKIALKSAVLKGTNGTEDFKLFTVNTLAGSEVFDFTDESLRRSLLAGDSIPDGLYNAVEIEIYYLQMKIKIQSTRGIEYRNVRIYLSDDAEVEGGEHQPGDLTQIDEEGNEVGWLLGEGQSPDMDPVSPRLAAYTAGGDGTTWYDFAGKSAFEYGPFGDVNFMANSPHPVYNETVGFTFQESEGNTLVVEFNVKNCWQFEDKNEDGVFGAADLDPENPTRWHMNMPSITVFFE